MHDWYWYVGGGVVYMYFPRAFVGHNDRVVATVVQAHILDRAMLALGCRRFVNLIFAESSSGAGSVALVVESGRKKSSIESTWT